MKKQFKSIFALLLAVMLCLSVAPTSVFAMEATEQGIEQTSEPQQSEQPAESTGETPSPTASEPSAPDETKTPEPVPEATPNPTPEQTAEPTPDTTPPPAISAVQPELVKVVDKPLVKVIYYYYDEAQNQSVTDFTGYTVQSSHSYYAMAAANDAGITIAANKYPGKLPVSKDALRFRVLLNNSEDITSLAAYDTATGLVSLPAEYMGHEITVEWYCPASEVVELPVKVTASVYRNGAFTAATHDLRIASNANTISIPFAESNGLVVSQNGIDLDVKLCGVSGGALNVTASPLGGGLAVTAYAPSRTRGATTTVNHTRSASQIFYGYYTSYYTANGNTAFCLDPNVSGLNTGTYDVSGYIQRGTGYDDLIKAAYYLYGGPGYNGIKNNLFSDPDSMESYGLCHAAAAYMWLDDSSAFQGLSGATIGHLQNVIAAVNAQPMPPDGFEVFWYNVGSTTNQSLMSWEYAPTGSLEIEKVSANPSMTDGNPCYSLAGAVFDVFNSSGKKLGSITTDASGRGRLEDIGANETGLYIVEVSPPKGYAENTNRIDFQITPGQTTTKMITNKPQNDPIGIVLRKQDNDTAKDEPQGGALLAGAEFTVKYYKGLYDTESQLSGLTPARTWVLRTGQNGTAYLHRDYLVSGDTFYFAGNGDPTLPLGTVTIQETKAPEGYQINSELFIRRITAQGKAESVKAYNEPIVKEAVIRGGVTVEKRDFDLNRKADPQGDAALAGSVLEIYNRNDKSVVVGGTEYAPNTVVHTMTTDAAGTASTANDLLPYGDYEIVEKTPPTGYLNTGVIKQTFQIRNNGQIVSLKTNDTAIRNHVIRGGAEISKWDMERNEQRLKQGDATLAGAVFEIYNRGKNSVVVNGKEYAPGQVVHTMTTNADGWAGTANNLLPYSTYEIVEKTPPTGYLNTGIIRQTFQIRGNGQIVKLTASDKVIKNNIIRGGILAEKWDNEIDEHKAQGGATLEGAVFELVNRSADSVLVEGKLYGVGEVVYTMTTDKTGTAQTPADLLPYGTFECREVSPPTGYLATGVLSRTFTIREHGKIVELNTSDTAIKNNPIRGDLKGVKISDGDAKRLANVPFSITSKTTGESHVIVTDKNGELNTASEWNPHSQNTNRGETDRDGVWFGEPETLNDALGALLYDTYEITELPCEANKGYELLSFEVSVYRHNTTIDLGTMTDDYTATPEIFTMAADKESAGQDAHISETTTILDTVYYSGLKAGREYTVKGVLMDKATGEALVVDGKEVTAEKTFRALAESGSVAMEFTFDSTALAGKSVVVFETLFLEDKEIAAHADITDEGQTVTFKEPVIGTKATGIAGEKELDIVPDAKIVDTVSFDGLMIGQEYTVKGVLMDKTTGEPVLMDNQPVTAEKTFTAGAVSGTVEVTFTVNAALLKGKSVVVFESLAYKGREIAVHADIQDGGQTVVFKEPKIGTKAAGVDGKNEIIASKTAIIVDTVSYDGLAAGKTYTAKGILMDKATGKPLLDGGKEVTAETTFVAKETAGRAEVVFTFNAIDLGGKSVVVFEKLYHADMEIAAHADIEDAGQTVTIVTPKIGTTAKGADGNKIIPAHETAKIIDTVSYENLVVGEEYTVKGILMDKETGKPIMIDGKEVTAQTVFRAQAASGNVEVVFIFNSKPLTGKTIVVFEALEYEGKEVAAHADINDEAQTVSVENKPPASGNPQTGDDSNPALWVILCIVSLAGVVIAVRVIIRKKQTEK